MINRIAVTGSSGFIGTYLIKNSSGFSILEVDLISQKVEEIDFIGVDSVLHLAALVHQSKTQDDSLYFKVNRDLAYSVAQKAKEQGVRHFVLMSTVKVYGESTNELIPWDELSECTPMDAYGKSKLQAEKLIVALSDETFSVAIIRSPLVYGEGVKANMYNLIRLVERFPILPFKNIDNKRSMVYVGNLAALITQIIDTRASGVFIAGDQKPLSTAQICIYIAKYLNIRIRLFKIPPIAVSIMRKWIPSIYNKLFGSLIVDNSRTNSHLKFDPPYSSELGIEKMVKWYLSTKK